MDPLTHAASGALLALSCDRPRSAWAVPLAALVSASPDLDIFFSPAPVDYLLLHRGITHSLFAAPLLALVATLFMWVWWRKSTSGHWTFGRTWLMALGLLLLHIWLDCVTTYGTMIFLPFSDYRVRLNGVFIVDLLLLVPLLAGLVFALRRKALAVGLMVWIFAYPALCVGLRILHEHNYARHLAAEGVQTTQLTLLPDALAPLFWRALYQTDTAYTPAATKAEAASRQEFTDLPTPHSVHQQGLNWRGVPRTPVVNYPAAEQSLTRSLTAVSADAAVFFRFTLMPLQEVHSPATAPAVHEYRFYDLRFGTMLSWVDALMNMRRHGGIPFQLQARTVPGSNSLPHWDAVRMEFSGASRSSPWQAPVPPRPLRWWEWALGAGG